MKITQQYYIPDVSPERKEVLLARERKLVSMTIGDKIVRRFEKRTGSSKDHDKYLVDVIVLNRKEMEEKLGVVLTKTIMAALKK